MDISKTASSTTCVDRVINLIKSRQELIWVRTQEPTRFEEMMYERMLENQWELFCWSSTKGLYHYESHPREDIYRPDEPDFKKTDKQVELLFNKINELKTGDRLNGSKKSVFLMNGLNVFLNPLINQGLKDLKDVLLPSKTMVIVAPDLSCGNEKNLPLVLEKDIAVIDFNLPSREEIKSVMEGDLIPSAKRVVTKKKNDNPELVEKNKYSVDDKTTLIRAAQGMSYQEIVRAGRLSLVEQGYLNPDNIHQMKKQVISKTQLLDYIDPKESFDVVGGLDNSKDYIERFSKMFSEDAKKFGVKPLNGILLGGIPGTGKSLLAKAIANEWKMPLLSLDMGRVMGSLVGQSEENMRKVITLAEACAPCILHIDEIEKGLGGAASSHHSDGGTTARVLGTLLTWMQEKTSEVVIVATANNINILPPELIRRFNELFFVDIPTEVEREEIFEIHLALTGNGRSLDNLNKAELLKLTKGFTGAEIEKAVQEGLSASFYQGKKELTSEDLEAAVKATKPLSVVMKEDIKRMQEWAYEKARFASSLAEAEYKPKQKTTEKGADLGDLDVDLDD